MSFAKFVILITIAAYISIPVFIVYGIVWFTKREQGTVPDGPILSALKRTGIPVLLVVFLLIVALLNIASMGVGAAEVINGRVVDTRKSKGDYRLELSFHDGDKTVIFSPTP